jgi:hypothetical protein
VTEVEDMGWENKMEMWKFIFDYLET